MAPFERDEKPEQEKKEPTEPCSMCRRDTPVSQMTVVQGRRLCFGCAAAFFEDEDG
jgi:formylmethanofuran dehydrogenase subunit E